MMARRKSGMWAPTLLVATGILLGWVIYRQLAAAPNSQPLDDPAAVQVALVPDLPPEPEFLMPPLVTFEGVLERPIFSPTRRRPSEAAPVVLDQGGEVVFKLKGIIIDADQRIALVRPQDGKKNLRLPEGGRIGGWTVVTIEPGSVTFSRGEAETVLKPTFEAPSRKETRRKTRKEKRKQKQQQQQEQQQQQSGQLENLLQGEESLTSEQEAGQ